MEPWFDPRASLEYLPAWKTDRLKIRKIFRFLQTHGPAASGVDRLVSADYFDMLKRYRQARLALERHGLRLLDPSAARVSIPARRAGRPVWLCWDADEGRPGSWCERGESWEARRPLDVDGPWDPEGRPG